MKDITHIAILAALMYGAIQFIARNDMEAEYKPIEPSFAPDLAETEASEPEKLPPQKSILVPPAARVADSNPPIPAPAPSIEPVQPVTPAMAEVPVQATPASQATSAPVYRWHNTIEEAVQTAKLRNVPVLIHFVAPPCANCKLVRAMIDKTPRIQRELANYALVTIDGDAAPNLADQFKVREWNTWIIYKPWQQGKNGEAFIPTAEATHFLSDLNFTRQQLEKP